MTRPSGTRNAPGDTITLTRICPAQHERVFEAWTDPEELKHWYSPERGWVVGRVQVDLRVGGLFRVEFGPAGEMPFVEENEFLELEPPWRIVWSERVTRAPEADAGWPARSATSPSKVVPQPAVRGSGGSPRSRVSVTVISVRPLPTARTVMVQRPGPWIVAPWRRPLGMTP